MIKIVKSLPEWTINIVRLQNLIKSEEAESSGSLLSILAEAELVGNEDIAPLLRAFGHSRSSHYHNVLVNMEFMAFCVQFSSHVRNILFIKHSISSHQLKQGAYIYIFQTRLENLQRPWRGIRNCSNTNVTIMLKLSITTTGNPNLLGENYQQGFKMHFKVKMANICIMVSSTAFMWVFVSALLCYCKTSSLDG